MRLESSAVRGEAVGTPGGISMKTRTLLAPILCFGLAIGACATPDRPSEAEYNAAQSVVQAHEDGDPIPLDMLEDALNVIAAYEEPGLDWWQLGGTALGVLLGVPALGGRGRQLIGAFSGALANGDVVRMVQTARAYVGNRHSTDILAAHAAEAAVKAQAKADKAKAKAETA